VVIDNLPAHTAAGVRGAIEVRGATLRYLPTCTQSNGLRRHIGSFARNLTALDTANCSGAASYMYVKSIDVFL
jgi:hypothetical protein